MGLRKILYLKFNFVFLFCKAHRANHDKQILIYLSYTLIIKSIYHICRGGSNKHIFFGKSPNKFFIKVNYFSNYRVRELSRKNHIDILSYTVYYENRFIIFVGLFTTKFLVWGSTKNFISKLNYFTL